MEALLFQIFSGLANGIIYGSVALALVMIYQATHHINFAQGEMATFSTFIAAATSCACTWRRSGIRSSATRCMHRLRCRAAA